MYSSTSHPNRNCVKDGVLIFGFLKERAATGAYILLGEATLVIRFNGRALDDIRESIKGDSALLSKYPCLTSSKNYNGTVNNFFKGMMQVNESDERRAYSWIDGDRYRPPKNIMMHRSGA